MGITSLVGIGIAVIIIIMIFLIFKADKRTFNKKPYLLSVLALSLIILNWFLYLMNFYAVIPERIGDLIFLPIWIVVTMISFIAAYKEFNNNRTLAVVNGGLAIISFVVAMLSWGIGSM